MQERSTASGLCGSARVRRIFGLKVLDRLRFLKGPLLVECGWSFFSTRNCEDETSPDVDTHKFPSSHRRHHGATEILSSHIDPVDLHCAQFWYSCRLLDTQYEKWARWRALPEHLQQERIETDVAYAWQHILCGAVLQ